MDWTAKKCVPCEGGVPALGVAQVEEGLRSLRGWDVQDEHRTLHKHHRFHDFREAMRFVNALAALAEAEGHHPDFTVRYNVVDVRLSTHAVGGLTENDFILAAKLDQLERRGSAE